jgi:hypothetical protein
MLDLFMALLSFRGLDTPSLLAQGEQRRSSYFNINRDNSTLRADRVSFHFRSRRMLYLCRTVSPL